MIIGGKIRIYDLARSKIPEHFDEKIKKKIQAELTKQILKFAQDFGQNAKTASSSVDEDIVVKIFEHINLTEIFREEGGVDLPLTPPPSSLEAPKKQLKIVRRIKAVEEESPILEPVQEEPPVVQTPEIIEEKPVLPVEDLQNILGKKTTYSRDTLAPKDISNVRSIPLKPVSSVLDNQPYRVAKPTISTQGIGRKKKRSHSSEDRPKQVFKPVIQAIDEGPKEITITKPMTVRELSHAIAIAETQIITYFFMKKIVKTVNDILEKDLIIEYLKSLNYIVHTEELDEGHIELKSTLQEDQTEGNLIQRPPVVTIMGHVDHGKTTLVDTIRRTKTKIVDKESGGITQHISTYRIEVEDFDGNRRKITLLDTPGHEAFTAMRKRGANVTDIVILIVAADDGVKPQTIECIKHIKENNIPFLVAVNKIDKPGANPDKALAQLAEYGVITQNYGGSVECAFVSALQNKNIDDLLMKVMLVADAELADKIQSNPNRLAIGTVIEAELSRTKGPIATVLIQNGTLRIGDFIAAGAVFGKVKAMIDELGLATEMAEPSTAVRVLGLSGVPKAGDSFKAYDNIKQAKETAEDLANKELEAKRFRGIYSFASEIREGQEKELRIIIKADVQGSAEAIAHEINKLSTGEVLVKPIVIESGSITSNDVQMAEQTGAVIVGFHVGADTAATAKLAEKLNVMIRSYEIIYKLTEDLEKSVLGLHQPEIQEAKVGEIEIRKIFVIDGRNIAGSYVRSGKIIKDQIARVYREGAKIYEGKIDYLRRFKDDAKEIREGFECGLSFEKYNDLVEGDIVECWTLREIAKTRL